MTAQGARLKAQGIWIIIHFLTEFYSNIENLVL